MQKAISFFRRKKSPSPFKDFYSEWTHTLKHTLLPLLRRSLSSTSTSSTNLLSKHVEMLHRHFESYYDALDNAAANDVAQLLCPDWRNSLEKPFLWLGDLHPYLFARLLRSFLDDPDDPIDGGGGGCDPNDPQFLMGLGMTQMLERPWHVVMAWNSPSNALMSKIGEIERGLRLVVPALAARGRHAQSEFVGKMGREWGRTEMEKGSVAEEMEVHMEEMVSVFVDANRIRRSVLSEIISVTSVYQAAFFLEGLSQFLLGFKDQKLLSEFKRSQFLES